MTAIQGKKYQSDSASGNDWQADGTTPRKGFPCLKFSMDAPQYYQYNFTSDGDGNDDGRHVVGAGAGRPERRRCGLLLFTLGGSVNPTLAFNLAPNIVELNPEE